MRPPMAQDFPRRFTRPSKSPKGEHIYHLYVIETADRDRLQQHLRARQIDTGIHYPHELFPELLEPIRCGGQSVPRRLAEHRLARRGELLQALAQVHGVADDRVLDPLLAAEQRGGHLAGAEPDARARTARSPSACPSLVDGVLARGASPAAAASARSAWSSRGTGAPNTAITASPTYCITVPPSARMARFISARWRLSCCASTAGSACSAIVE